MSDDLNSPITKRGTRRKREVTPQHHDHLKRVGWQKGESGNRAGRPKDDPEFEAARAAAVRRSLTRMEALAESSENEMVQYKANEWLLNTELSKAATRHEVEVTKNESLTILIESMHEDAPDLIEAETLEIAKRES